MHMYSIFTVGHNTQYYTNWEMKVVAFINFINIFKGEITSWKNKIKIMPLIIVIFLQITFTIK